MKQVDTDILYTRATGAFATDTGIFKVEETPYQIGDGRIAEIGYYSTFERAVLEVIARSDGGRLLADEGKHPTTNAIEPYVHFCDLEDLMMGGVVIDHDRSECRSPRLFFKTQFDDGPDMTYIISFIKLGDDETPGT